MERTLERGYLLHKRYRIVEILGQGGMGSVYRAVDENLGVDVAVKENLFTTDEYARQFRLEAVILANLRHPNLPRVTDHFVIGEQGQYLIMDYIEGEDLRQRMERVGVISEEEAILIGAAMCDALQYLHTRKPPIIHRDVKPGNVRITPDGHIYLVDFGLAKLVKGAQATTTGARAMTPGYSPPEQYGMARTDPRTDIYSLGATLYAALTGVIPEDGLARAMDNVELTPLRKRNPKVSRKLAAAIEKAMAVNPADRFESAEAFKQALLTSNVKTQRLEGEPLVKPAPQLEEDLEPLPPPPAKQGPPPASKPPSQPPKKKGWSAGFWVAFSFFLLTILLALLAVIIFWSPIVTAIRHMIVSPTTALTTPDISLTKTREGENTGASFNPGNGASPTPSHTSQPTASPTPTWTPTLTPLPSETPTPTETLPPTATPLGGGYGQIAFVSDRTGAPQIWLMDASGGNLVQVTNMPDGACQPDWSPDGRRLVFISPCLQRQDPYRPYTGAALYIINADGSQLMKIPSESDAGDFDPAWSPDGARIAFASLRDGSSQIYVLNLNDNTVTRLTEASSAENLPDWSRHPAWSPSGTQILYTAHSRLTGALQIWSMSDAGRGPKRLILRSNEYWNFNPNWSPDGTKVLFSETKGKQELGWLLIFDLEIDKPSQAQTLRPGLKATNGDYSPDGLWIVYESLDSADPKRTDYDIYLINPSRLIRLTDKRSMEFDPVWRPIRIP